MLYAMGSIMYGDGRKVPRRRSACRTYLRRFNESFACEWNKTLDFRMLLPCQIDGGKAFNQDMQNWVE
jgi:hypothetical protein